MAQTFSCLGKEFLVPEMERIVRIDESRIANNKCNAYFSYKENGDYVNKTPSFFCGGIICNDCIFYNQKTLLSYIKSNKVINEDDLCLLL